MKRNVTVPFFISHQGCSHRCVFCDQTAISGGEEGVPSEYDLLGVIESYRVSSGRSRVDVAFFGGTFTALPREVQDRLLLPLQLLVAAGTVGRIRISTRPDAIDEATALFLRERQVTIVELGAQSLNDDVLRKSGRGHLTADVEMAVQVLRAHGFDVGLQLMVGLPGDTAFTYCDSVRRALSLHPDFLRVYPTLVVAGTELERLFHMGKYVPLSLDEAVSLCAETLRLAHRAGVSVIRVGLQPTDDLAASGNIVAGPYHPAFRQLVESRLCFDLVSSLIRKDEGLVTIRCAPDRVSDVIGQKRSNVSRLLRECGIVVERVLPDPRLGRMELELEVDSGRRKGNLVGMEAVNG